MPPENLGCDFRFGWIAVCPSKVEIWGSVDIVIVRLFDGPQAHNPDISKRSASRESLMGLWLAFRHAFGFLPPRRPWRFVRTVHVAEEFVSRYSPAQGPYFDGSGASTWITGLAWLR